MTSSDPYPVLRLMQSHLEGRLRLGEKRLWLSRDAAEALREIVRMKPQPWPQKLEGRVMPQGGGTVGLEEKRQKAEKTGPKASGTGDGLAGRGAEHPQRLVLPDRPDGGISFEAKKTRLAAVRKRALQGEAARALGTLRQHMVFAAGPPTAELVLVGGAPGAEEEQLGEPFAGPAGKLLGRILKAMGLDRSMVYLTLLCKYRPEPEPGERGERTLTAEEGASCLSYVQEEIAIIQPKVVVLLGDIPFAGLLGRWGGVMQGRGKFYALDGIPVMATLDPSYLQEREADGPEAANAEKRKLWEDMLMVMEKLGLPVSEKQRGFFLPK